MVEAPTKNQNIFWIWSDKVDWAKRGDVFYWLPEFLDIEKSVKSGTNLQDLLIKNITYGHTPLGGKNTYTDKGILFIRSGQLNDFFLDLTDNVYISEATHRKMQRSIITGRDVLVATVGATIGAVAIIPENIKEANCNQAVGILRTDEKRLNPYYLAIYLSSPYGKEQILRQSSGGARDNLDPFELKRVRVILPSITDQQKVEQIVKEAFQLKKEAEKEYQEATNVFLENIKTYISGWDTLTTEAKRAFWLWSDQVDIASRIDPDYYSGEGMINKLGKTKSLGELAEIKIGKTPAFDDYLPRGKRRIMKFRAITGRGIDLENEERGFVKEEFFQKNKRNKLNEDDIVLGSAAHQAHYIGKYLDIVDELPKEFADGVLTVAEIMTIRVDEALNPFVLLLFLRSRVGYELIQRQIKGQTSHLYPKDVAGIGIPEAVIKISKSKIGVEVEGKIQSSLTKARLSKQKLQEAKDFVENLITK